MHGFALDPDVDGSPCKPNKPEAATVDTTENQ
jgi:hypothetical protein